MLLPQVHTRNKQKRKKVVNFPTFFVWQKKNTCTNPLTFLFFLPWWIPQIDTFTPLSSLFDKRINISIYFFLSYWYFKGTYNVVLCGFVSLGGSGIRMFFQYTRKILIEILGGPSEENPIRFFFTWELGWEDKAVGDPNLADIRFNVFLIHPKNFPPAAQKTPFRVFLI